MTYKGKEIDEVTLEIVDEYIKNNYKRRYANYDKYKGEKFIVSKVLDRVIKKITHPRRKKPINDIESEILYILKDSGHLCFTEEYRSYLEVERKKRNERYRVLKEKIMRPVVEEIVSNKKHPFSQYSEQLKDEKWKAFRDFVLVVRGKKCEMCGATEKLQIHHPNYIKGRKAWEYNCNEVIVLCEQCHRNVHGL
jgi:5-methylcytosine-specific restriction endonuclease McrA